MRPEDAMLPYRRPPGETPQKAGPGCVEGVCKAVTAAGMTFTVPDWDEGKHVFGPAPWPMSRVEPAVVPGVTGGGSHDHLETKPTVGDRVLVLFLTDGVERPWVIGWWPA